MTGSSGYRFTIPSPLWLGDEVVPLLMDSSPWWMPKDFQKPGLFIGSVIRDGDNAIGCIYMPETSEKEVFYCTPLFAGHGEITHFAFSDLKIDENSERTQLQPMWG